MNTNTIFLNIYDYVDSKCVEMVDLKEINEENEYACQIIANTTNKYIANIYFFEENDIILLSEYLEITKCYS